jgi:predicted transcriptional regulator
MKVVWRTDEATVRDVYEALQETRPVAYTTVMTMMRILQEKGYLTKATNDRAHVYRPAKPSQQVIGGMVRDFLDRVFDGASDALLVHLAPRPDRLLGPGRARHAGHCRTSEVGEDSGGCTLSRPASRACRVSGGAMASANA